MNWRKIKSHQMKSLNPVKSRHWPQIILFGVIVLLSTKLSAQETELKELAKVELESKTYGKMEVIVTRVENILGMPYQADLKAKCPGKSLKIINSDNYCDVRLTSPKMVSDGVIELQVREVDADKFNRLTRTLDPEAVIKLKPTCLKEPKTVQWKLKDFCN